MVEVRSVPTHRLARAELRALRRLLDEAFNGGFTDDDWDHTVGGVHVLAVERGIVAHASVVERLLVAAGRTLRSGYVEGVATATTSRQRGHSSAVMREVGNIIQANYQLGGLSTGLPDFYLRFGWEMWRGRTYASSPTGLLRTADDDDAVMVLRTSLTRDLDPTTTLVCDWRRGDVW